MEEKNNNSLVPIVLAFTPNYFVPAATCILSILKHVEKGTYFHFICLLTEELPSELRHQLIKLGGVYSQFSFIDLTGKLQDIYVDEKYTIAASYRLLLPDLLPQYDKVLYLDCDMIIQNNLAELYHEVDLNGFYMAGVFEATLDFQKSYMEAIGCDPGTYINSGLLLMNLALLRKDGMVKKFLEGAKKEGLQFPDQDVINQLCKGKILGLPPYWNSIRTFLLPQYKATFLHYYTEQDWQDVQCKGNVHYTGAKPWNNFTVAFDLWWRHYEELPAEVKNHAKVNPKMEVVYSLYRTGIGKKVIDSLRVSYRKLKVN